VTDGQTSCHGIVRTMHTHHAVKTDNARYKIKKCELNDGKQFPPHPRLSTFLAVHLNPLSWFAEMVTLTRLLVYSSVILITLDLTVAGR